VGIVSEMSVDLRLREGNLLSERRGVSFMGAS